MRMKASVCPEKEEFATYFRKDRRNRKVRDLKHKRHLIRLWEAKKGSIFPPVLYVEYSMHGWGWKKKTPYYKRNTPTHGGGSNRYLKRMSNRKVRYYRGGIARGGNYKKLCDYQWMLW